MSTASRHPPAGSRVTIHLSHLPVDYDLVVYGPSGQVLVPPVSGTPPLDGAAVDDPGVTPTHGTDALPPQTLADVPIDAGRTVVGISANRGIQDDAVTFFSQGGPQPVPDPDLRLQRRLEQRAVHGARRGAPAAYAGHLRARFVGNNPAAAGSEQPAAAPANVNTVFVVNRHSSHATTRPRWPTRRSPRSGTAHHVQERRLPELGPAGRRHPACAMRTRRGMPAPRIQHWPTPSWPRSTRAYALFKAAKPTVQYIVLVGSDDVIPFARLDDRTTLSNEDSFAGSFAAGSPIGGALAASKMLSDDPYGTLAPIPFFDRQLYVPELGVSRLVETPAQIQAQVNAYTTGQITGGSALTTGYDFLTDGAQQVSASLARVATTATNATLLPPTVWSAANLAAALTANGGQPPKLVSINAHADDSRFQAADHTLFTTDDSSRQR